LIQDGFLKFLKETGIDSEESIPPAYVAWRASTINLIPTRFLAPKDCLKISVLMNLAPFTKSIQEHNGIFLL
jgi:hypothetical protein